MEINLGIDVLNVKTSTNVTMFEHFTIYTLEGPIDLKVEIKADFYGIPDKYHEVMLNVLTSKYHNKVSFGSNPFSECKLPKKRKWWEFFMITVIS